MEELFKEFAGSVALGVEIVAVLIIAFGAIEAFVRILGLVFQKPTHGQRKEVWRRFGVWLLLGLEFELASDIIRTVISPTWIDLGQLGAIAVIRTFLNYFLEKDLEESAKPARAAEGMERAE